MQREQNITQVFIFRDWTVALLSIPSTPRPPPPSLVAERGKQKTNRETLSEQIPWKRPCLLFLVSIISQDPETICACTEYIGVRDIYYIRLNGLNKEPLASGYNPITAGLALSLSLSPAVPGFPSPISLKVRFSGKIQETSSCFIHSLLPGSPR